ncbi:MAG: MerR family transcriptional regulator [Candidatus Limnocylindrales bacterium]
MTMRISELSRRSGVSIPTIKYYLRERLLPPGESSSAANQASYGETHLHRLRLIRALRVVGDLDIDRIRRVVDAIDDVALPRHELLGVAQRALEPPADPDGPTDDVREARVDVDQFLEELGWEVAEDAPGRAILATTLAALRRLGRDVGADVFTPYADAADRLAWWEIETIPPSVPAGDAVERMVVGTVLFERALMALRRLAHEHHSARAGR